MPILPVYMRSELANEIKSVLRKLSHQTFANFAKISNSTVSDFQAKQTAPKRQVFFVIADWALKITVYMYYDYAVVTAFVPKLESPEKIDDYMKEVGNLIGGSVMQAIESPERPVGISIPYSAKVLDGFKPLNSEPPSIFRDGWQLNCTNGAVLYFFSQIVVLNEQAANETKIKNQLHNVAEVEFF